MGCVASKLDINDVHPNMFAVNNVDEMGSKLSPGQLEITESDLVLHQKGKQPIKWPLKYLKRYTFGADLFSFEAGRKNPTGPGIYAFKCRRAENLFNLVQLRVRNQGPSSGSLTGGETASPLRGDTSPLEEASGPRWSSSTAGATNTVAYGQIVGSQPQGQQVGGQNSTTQPRSPYINCPLPTTTGATSSPPRVPPLHSSDPITPGYMNITQERPNTINTSPGAQTPANGAFHLPPLSPNITPESKHEYENVGPETTTALRSPGYLQLPPKPSFYKQLSKTPHEISELEVSAQTNPEQTPAVSPCITENSINYIVLDLDTSGTASAPKQISPTLKTNNEDAEPSGLKDRGYVTIDFDKTDALIKSANQRFFEDDAPGIRKTRHNSSLSELGNGKLNHN